MSITNFYGAAATSFAGSRESILSSASPAAMATPAFVPPKGRSYDIRTGKTVDLAFDLYVHGNSLELMRQWHLKYLGSGLIGHNQKMTVAARAMAEKKTVGHRS